MNTPLRKQFDENGNKFYTGGSDNSPNRKQRRLALQKQTHNPSFGMSFHTQFTKALDEKGKLHIMLYKPHIQRVWNNKTQNYTTIYHSVII